MTEEEKKYIEEIKGLFESQEDENIILGLEILKGLKFFKPLFTHLLVITLHAQKSETRLKAKLLLKKNAPENLYNYIKKKHQSRQRNYATYLEEFYKEMEQYPEIDTRLFALLTLQFTKQGGKFCLENKIAEPRIILEAMCHKDHISLEHFNLLFLPEELGKLTHLTSLNLNNNRLVDIPDSLQNLKKIDSLYYEDATITKRAKNKLEQYFPKVFAQDYYYEAVNLLHREQTQEALSLLEKAAKLDPKSDRIWFELGFALDNLKEYEKAIKCYNKSLDLKEKKQNLNTTSYILNLANKALSLQCLGKESEKVATAQKVLEVVAQQSSSILQGNANFSFSQGLALYLLEKYEEAQKAYDNAISIDPYYAVAWYNKACTYAMQRQKKEMLQCLKKAGKLRPMFLRTAPEDQDFEFYLEDKDFQQLVNL